MTLTAPMSFKNGSAHKEKKCKVKIKQNLNEQYKLKQL